MGDDRGIEMDEITILSLRSGEPLLPLRFANEYGDGYGSYKSRRVLRSALFRAMLAVARSHSQISVHFEKKLVKASRIAGTVALHFEDEFTAMGDLVLGCDGVHSVMQTQLVEPGSSSEYTGISFIQSLAAANRVNLLTHFDHTAIHLARQGSLLASYCNPSHSTMFVAAIMRINEEVIERYRAITLTAKEDDAALDSLQMALRYQVRSTFGASSFPWIQEWIKRTHDWALYPVYQVRQHGKWHVDGVLLLRDAAHAMPPREESAAYAIEGAVIFAQIVVRGPGQPLSELMVEYENSRRRLLDKAFDTTWRLWQSDLDRGLFPNHFRDCMSPIQLDPRLHDKTIAEKGRPGSLPPPTYESMSDLSVYTLANELSSLPADDAVGALRIHM